MAEAEFPKHFLLRVNIEEHAWKEPPQQFVEKVKYEVEAASRDLFDFIVKEKAANG